MEPSFFWHQHYSLHNPKGITWNSHNFWPVVEAVFPDVEGELQLASTNWPDAVLKTTVPLICLAYLDNIVVYGRTFEEHIQRLWIVLSQLRYANLKPNPKKCQFFQQSVSFLGHVISRHGVRTDPTKLTALRNGHHPSTYSNSLQRLLLRCTICCRKALSSQPLVVPQSLVSLVIQSLHNGVGGRRLSWPKLWPKSKIDSFGQGWDATLKTGVSNALLRPSKVTKPNSTGTFSPNLCWLSNRTHCIGLIEPTSNNSSWQQTYLSCLQLFTRWTEAYALPNKEAATVARVLENGWICHFGVPDTIHSHQGANFEGHLFTEVGELLGIEKSEPHLIIHNRMAL